MMASGVLISSVTSVSLARWLDRRRVPGKGPRRAGGRSSGASRLVSVGVIKVIFPKSLDGQDQKQRQPVDGWSLDETSSSDGASRL